MSSQSSAVWARVSPKQGGVAGGATAVSSRVTVVVFRIVGFIIICYALSIAAVVYFAAQAQAPSMNFVPPRQFLPDSVLPASAYCKVAPDGHCYPPLNTHCNVPGDGRCFTSISQSVDQPGKTIYLTVDLASGQIVQTVIPENGYSIGDLITIWGTPIGVQQSGKGTTVYWSSRSAYVIACPFRPGSRVAWLTYFTTPIETQPWRGFRNRNRKYC